MRNSDVFLQGEADAYFQRNREKRTFLIDYLLSLFPKKEFHAFDVAEFGVGAGHNLHLLSHFVNRIHGYEGSPQAVEYVSRSIQNAVNQEKFHIAHVNLCEPFETPIPYHLVIYGFFAYLLSDDELKGVQKNLNACLLPGGCVYVSDFLTRSVREKQDRRLPGLRIFKRDLTFWLNLFSGFDLVEYRLFHGDRIISYRDKDSQSVVDLDLPDDDDLWTFGALFRRRRITP